MIQRKEDSKVKQIIHSFREISARAKNQRFKHRSCTINHSAAKALATVAHHQHAFCKPGGTEASVAGEVTHKYEQPHQKSPWMFKWTRERRWVLLLHRAGRAWHHQGKTNRCKHL